MQKILVTGASGFVGSRFVKRWCNEYTLLTPSHSEMDITDAASVDNYVMNNVPDVVVHLAAISNTLYCEQHPEESYKVNVEGAVNLARAAVRFGAKFVFFSSDQVYNGNTELGLLSENVAVSPENVYGCHKLEAEERIADISADAVMLRHIQRCGGFIADQQLRLRRKGNGNDDPLAHTPGKFKGILVKSPLRLRDPHLGHQRDGPFFCLCGGQLCLCLPLRRLHRL